MKKMVHVNLSSTVSLSKNQSVLVLAQDQETGVGYVGYSSHDPVFGTLTRIISNFVANNEDSIMIALNDAVTDGVEQGLIFLEDDPIVVAAKDKAVQRVFSEHPEQDWFYDYFVAMNLANNGRVSYQLCEAYEGMTGNAICKILNDEFESFMSFAKIVEAQQPEVFLLTTDYDGGQVESWVVKGSIEDARKEMVEALNELLPESRQITLEQLDDFLESSVGSDCDYIYTASIDKV